MTALRTTAFLLLPLVFAPLTAADHGTVQTKTYTLGGQITFLNSCSSSGGVGGAVFCLGHSPAPSTVSVSIVDDVHLLTVGGQVQFRDAGSIAIGSENICGSVANLAVPPATARVNVFVSAVAGTFAGCVANPGTTGTITVTWSPT